MKSRPVNEVIDAISFEIGSFFADNLAPVNIGCEIDFGYYEDENEIAWGLLANEQCDTLFAKFIEEELGCSPIHVFIYSLFHEYGHKMTLGNFCQEDRDRYDRDNLENANVEDFFERNNNYWHFPIELAASRWAVNYINTHYDMIIGWVNEKLCPLMEELENGDGLNELIEEYNHQKEFIIIA